jgi:serine/threonine protein kinase/Tol biopolymer transport system component
MITHDRWQRIKEIFQSAQELGATERLDFLNEVCGDDEAMREEVEALLTADTGNDDFLSSPAYEFAAGMLADEESEFSPGQQLGRYEILCLLGAGGMGQIYLAHDPQLDRKIALKLISREFATDTRRVHRFEQEARAASALNHPNVCVIHEIGVTENNRHFIAMEHIQGVTLRDQLSRGTFTVRETLNVAAQVAAALASAHAAGIVHRDIKPENIMLRPDGYVKVLDFGLAKLTEILPEAPRLHELSTVVLTEAGTLMGTVKYMSPEQLRKSHVDERTDIWSLGIVLYEMLTGSTPFDARTPNEMVDLISDAQPTPLAFPAGLPIQFQDIVRKALQKDRALRYQTITKLASDLKTLQRELQRQSESDFEPALVSYAPAGNEHVTRKVERESAIFTRILSSADFLFSEIRSHKTAAFFTGATGVLAFLLFLPNLIDRFFSSPNEPIITMKAVTNAGTSVCSTISPDGKRVAHAEQQDGKQRLVLTSTATFAASVVVPPDYVEYLGVTFSRDNNYLYFTRREKNSAGILYRLAVHGGASVRIKDDVESPIGFSPQGDQFAFVRLNEAAAEYYLMLSDVDGGNERTLATRKNGNVFSTYGLSWSPDGSMIVCPAGRWNQGFHMDLVAIDSKNGNQRVIGKQSWFSIFEVAWQEDMAGLVISATERETSPHQLWRITYPEGAAQRILTPDLAEYRGVSLSGDKIVTVRTDRSWRIWVSTPADSAPARAIASGVGFNYGLSWTAKGRIVFSSMAQDRLNISRVEPDGSHRVQLTINAGDNYNPAASADGRLIVFVSNRKGSFNLWSMNADDGSELRQLTFTEGNFYPSVSPDNQWVAYDNLTNLKSSIWKVPLQGGDPVKLGERYRMPVFSPDSQLIAARYDLISGSRDLAIFSAAGGAPLRQVPIPILDWQRVQWLDSHTLSYIKNVDGYSNIWSYDLDTGSEKQLTQFSGDQIYAYAWSSDRKQVACQRGTRISDVTVISSER